VVDNPLSISRLKTPTSTATEQLDSWLEPTANPNGTGATRPDRRLTVLLADDEAVNRSTVSRILERSDHLSVETEAHDRQTAASNPAGSPGAISMVSLAALVSLEPRSSLGTPLRGDDQVVIRQRSSVRDYVMSGAHLDVRIER
jgi:hypothetical protein